MGPICLGPLRDPTGPIRPVPEAMKVRDALPVLMAAQALVILIMLVVVIVQVSLSRAIWRTERDLRLHARAHTPAATPSPDGQAQTQRLPKRAGA